jgi:tripartite-type tricarboxylate transporter receptor subunit TctC
MIHSGRLLCAAAALGVACSGATARADAVADFYRGRTVTIQVGFGAGGGYDITTRIVARHFGDHIPGHPTVLVQNLPGGGSMKLANYIYNAAPKDGTMLGVFTSAVSVEPVYGDKQAKFDARKFEWIANMDRDIESCGAWKTSGIRTFPDLLASKKAVVFGSTSPAATTSQFPMLMKHLFHANIKVINGYKGTRDIDLAMQNGEVHAMCGMYESSVKGPFADDVKSGNMVLFVQLGADRKVPAFGNATQLITLVKDPEDRKITEMLFRQDSITRPLAAPPGTPKDRVAALRKALVETMKDPGLIADGKKINVEFDPMTGEEVQKFFVDFYKSPPALIKKAYSYIQIDSAK